MFFLAENIKATAICKHSADKLCTIYSETFAPVLFVPLSPTLSVSKFKPWHIFSFYHT